MNDISFDVKIKASEYASLTGLSLNTVKNRIKAGVLKGSKEEDGVWYVYLTQEELEHLRSLREREEEGTKNLQANLEGMKSTLEGSLIATYMSALMMKEQQKEQLLHELSSLYTLLAIREKEMEFLLKELELLRGKCEAVEQENKELKDKLREKEEELAQFKEKLKEKDYIISQKDLELQRVVLDKDREILSRDMELSVLKMELEKRKRKE
jgi:chromosome segregation ATPase